LDLLKRPNGAALGAAISGGIMLALLGVK